VARSRHIILVELSRVQQPNGLRASRPQVKQPSSARSGHGVPFGHPTGRMVRPGRPEDGRDRVVQLPDPRHHAGCARVGCGQAPTDVLPPVPRGRVLTEPQRIPVIEHILVHHRTVIPTGRRTDAQEGLPRGAAASKLRLPLLEPRLPRPLFGGCHPQLFTFFATSINSPGYFDP
jgi:hypothetical protein